MPAMFQSNNLFGLGTNEKFTHRSIGRAIYKLNLNQAQKSNLKMKTIKNLFGFVGVGVGIILLSQTISAFGQSATTVLVGSGGLRFVPATASIPVNGTVIWSWAGSFHSTTSGNSGTANGLWDSGVFSPPHSFTNTFNSVGTFPYYCSVHFSEGMLGNIIVTNNIAVAPTVTITNPPNNVVLSAPASLTLAASASVASGSVTNVQFLQDSVSLGNSTAAPFSVQVDALAAGNYTFSAIATADDGLTATNSISVSVINPSPVVISAPALPVSGHFQFTYVSDIGLTYVVESSTSLSSGWSAIATNTATTNPTQFTDPSIEQTASYYRVLRQPNP